MNDESNALGNKLICDMSSCEYRVAAERLRNGRNVNDHRFNWELVPRMLEIAADHNDKNLAQIESLTREKAELAQYKLDADHLIIELGEAQTALRQIRDTLRAELKLMEHKVITCGVVASHPDPKLTLRADYMKWDSPQAEQVRALRAELDASKVDAERYRFIREDAFDARLLFTDIECGDGIGSEYAYLMDMHFGEGLDEAIDTALSRGETGEKIG